MKRRRHYTPWYLSKVFFGICGIFFLGCLVYLSHDIPIKERTLKKIPISLNFEE